MSFNVVTSKLQSKLSSGTKVHRFFTCAERIAVIAIESSVNYSFLQKCIQTRCKGQYKVELTLASRLHVYLSKSEACDMI